MSPGSHSPQDVHWTGFISRQPIIYWANTFIGNQRQSGLHFKSSRNSLTGCVTAAGPVYAIFHRNQIRNKAEVDSGPLARELYCQLKYKADLNSTQYSYKLTSLPHIWYVNTQKCYTSIPFIAIEKVGRSDTPQTPKLLRPPLEYKYSFTQQLHKYTKSKIYPYYRSISIYKKGTIFIVFI